MAIKAVFNRIVNLEIWMGVMSTNNAFELPLVQNDTGPLLNFSLKEPAGASISVSGGGKVRLYLKRFQTPGHTNQGHELCSPVDSVSSTWQYNLQAGDISATGTYFGDVEIEYDSGIKETAYEAVRFLVRPANK